MALAQRTALGLHAVAIRNLEFLELAAATQPFGELTESLVSTRARECEFGEGQQDDSPFFFGEFQVFSWD